jgi:hypothetical protein
VLLPDTPPFETDGHLVAKIDSEKAVSMIIAILTGVSAKAIYMAHSPIPPVNHVRNWKAIWSLVSFVWPTLAL